MLLQDFAETFLQICRDDGNSPGELQQKTLALRNHLVPFFGDMALNAINPATVRQYSKQKLFEEYSPKTINNHLLVLSRLLKIARDDGHLSAPAFRIKLQSIERDEARYLNREEIERLIDAARQDADPSWAHMLTFALHTGLRIGELLALDWTKVNFEQRNIVIDRSFCRVSQSVKKTKNGRRRDVALNNEALAAISHMTHRDGTVWGVDYPMAYAAMNRIAARADLEGIGWHTLRHTFASMLVLQGQPLFIVSRLLGHSSIAMTERYAHLNPEKNRDAVAMLSLALAS